MKKVAVIGSGFSSLSASCYLARMGYAVTLFEKNDQTGGRARQWLTDGFTFDMGPTWYWMPEIFENFFLDFGKKTTDYYSLNRLDPSYRIYFGEHRIMDLPAGMDRISALFEKYEPGSAAKLERFMKIAEKTYRVTVAEMVHVPGHSPLELITSDTVRNASLFLQSIRQLVRKMFRHPYLRMILEFPVLFLGAKPGKIPAFYNFMNYADFELGTWFPSGGMYSVVKAMHALAIQLGVAIHVNREVERIEVQNGRATRIFCGDVAYEFDLVVSGADYHHSEQLLAPEDRTYTEKYWEKRTFAPSALLFFLGLDCRLSNVMHHTLFFDADFDPHAAAIYDHKRWPDKPLFYVNVPSITDPSCAPAGKENMTVLIPIAPGLEDTPDVRERYFEEIMARMEQLTGQSIRDKILVKRSYCVRDFETDYHSYKGNAYGLANTLSQTAFLRPKIRSRNVNNLYFAGQLTVPGPGVPPCIISGKIVAEEIRKYHPPHEA